MLPHGVDGGNGVRAMGWEQHCPITGSLKVHISTEHCRQRFQLQLIVLLSIKGEEAIVKVVAH